MSFRSVLLLFDCVAVIVVTVCGSAIVGRGQSANQQATSPRGAVRGRVTIDGRPASGMIIILQQSGFRLYTIGPHSSRQQHTEVKTDKMGRYRASNIPAGDYNIFPKAPGLVATNLNQFRQAQTVTVKPGKTFEKVDFVLTRGGVITGRVVTSAGQPMIETQVHCHRHNQDSDRWEEITGGRQTDDRGVYRFFGLPAGKYRISSYNDYYPQTYHPDTTDETKAAIVEVKLGAEMPNVDVRYGRSKNSYSAAGRLIDGQTGEPLSNFPIAAVWSENGQYTQDGAPRKIVFTDLGGRFQFTRISQGHHIATIVSSPESGDYRGDSVSFQIAGDDISGVEIKAYRGATISGMIVIEGDQDPAVLARISQLNLIGWQAAPSGAIGSSTPYFQIVDDGRFRISGLRLGRVNIQGGPWPKGFTLLRVERNGKELKDGLQVGPSEEVKDVRVFVGYGTGVIRGQVEANGQPLRGARGMLFVSRTDKPGKFVVSPINGVDSEGRFLIEGLLPGDYNVSFRLEGLGLYRDVVYANEVVSVKGAAKTPVKLIVDTAKQFTDERIILGGGKGTGVIRGQIEVNGHSLPDGARWAVFFKRVEKEDPAAGSFMEISASGRFLIEGLPPGEYKISVRLRPWWTDGADPYGGSDYAEQIASVKDHVETLVKLTVNLVNKAR